MIEKIQHATASSPEGAKGLVKGVLACAFQNMAFMLPTGLLYLLVKDLLAGSTSGRSTFYLVGCVACFVLILLTTWFQYRPLGINMTFISHLLYLTQKMDRIFLMRSRNRALKL